MSTESREIKTLRYMAWQRAKGELYALLRTYWDDENSTYDDFKEQLEEFIKEVEDKGLYD